jgi:hypothetical protein
MFALLCCFGKILISDIFLGFDVKSTLKHKAELEIILLDLKKEV